MEYSTPFCGFAMFYVKDCLDHLSYCITGIAQHVVKLLPSLNVTVRHQCPRWLSQARHKGFLSTGLTVSGPPHICLMDKCHTFGKPLWWWKVWTCCPVPPAILLGLYFTDPRLSASSLASGVCNCCFHGPVYTNIAWLEQMNKFGGKHISMTSNWQWLHLRALSWWSNSGLSRGANRRKTFVNNSV